jgi:hypothetical protein
LLSQECQSTADITASCGIQLTSQSGRKSFVFSSKILISSITPTRAKLLAKAKSQTGTEPKTGVSWVSIFVVVILKKRAIGKLTGKSPRCDQLD